MITMNDIARFEFEREDSAGPPARQLRRQRGAPVVPGAARIFRARTGLGGGVAGGVRWATRCCCRRPPLLFVLFAAAAVLRLDTRAQRLETRASPRSGRGPAAAEDARRLHPRRPPSRARRCATRCAGCVQVPVDTAARACHAGRHGGRHRHARRRRRGRAGADLPRPRRSRSARRRRRRCCWCAPSSTGSARATPTGCAADARHDRAGGQSRCAPACRLPRRSAPPRANCPRRRARSSTA